MTQTNDALDTTVPEDREPTTAEVGAWQRQDLLLPPDGASADQFPRLFNMSAGFMFAGMIRPEAPELPDYVTIPMGRMDSETLKLDLAVSERNMVWEAAQFRRWYFDLTTCPMKAKIADLGDVNVIFVPRTATRSYEYAPLAHLLPRRTLEQLGLPFLRAGQWPFSGDSNSIDRHLPVDFELRLSRSWASAVWPHLNSGSPLRAFSKDDPVRLLAHNLDFWIPPITAVIQETLGESPDWIRVRRLGRCNSSMTACWRVP